FQFLHLQAWPCGRARAAPWGTGAPKLPLLSPLEEHGVLPGLRWNGCGSLPGAQTERPGWPWPVRGLLGGMNLTGRLYAADATAEDRNGRRGLLLLRANAQDLPRLGTKAAQFGILQLVAVKPRDGQVIPLPGLFPVPELPVGLG